MEKIEELKPLELWKNFSEILKLPRGSGNEEGIRNFIIGICKTNNFWFEVDDVGNLLVKKKATQGKEKIKPLLLQSHLDMVNEKNSDINHDFLKDPIKAYITDDHQWIRAQGTTLGADDGIGVASMITIMTSKNLSHGPLELLFTVDEETGLAGATNLNTENIESRRMINLDSEEEGSLFISCAGGARIDVKIKGEYKELDERHRFLEIKISGLRGGHSGVDINQNRTNAIKLLNKIVNNLSENFDLNLVDFSGGNKSNAIPREATVVIAIKDEDYQKIKDYANNIIKIEKEKITDLEKEVLISLNDSTKKNKSLSNNLTKKVLKVIEKAPNGVLFMNKEVEGLVQTSINLGVIRFVDEQICINLTPRSSNDGELNWIINNVKTMFINDFFEERNRYPGWQESKNSQIVKHVVDKHKEKFGKPISIKGIHAGLECGIIGSKIKGLEMVSIGPEIRNAHSPDECVNINSVKNFYELLIKVLEELN